MESGENGGRGMTLLELLLCIIITALGIVTILFEMIYAIRFFGLV
jgi:hypothetical protein